MNVNQTKCDKCGFAQDNPAAFVIPVVINMRKATEGTKTIDASVDLCVRCFEVVEGAIRDAMAKP